MQKINVTIIGFGTMGKAIKKVLGKNSSIRIWTIDLDKKDVSGINKSDFIILSVKPQNAPEAIKDLKKIGLNKKTILISIMAGFPIKKIEKISGHKKIVRIMPNLGLSVGSGIAAWKGKGLSRTEKRKVEVFIGKISDNFEVKKENDIDKVTALSGSGPAYFFLLAESMLQASKKLGFSLEESKKLVEKTLLSSALLSKEGNYRELIKKVASKGGTTEAALKIFKNKKFEKIVLGAILAAKKRAEKLSK